MAPPGEEKTAHRSARRLNDDYAWPQQNRGGLGHQCDADARLDHGLHLLITVALEYRAHLAPARPQGAPQQIPVRDSPPRDPLLLGQTFNR